MFGLHNESNAQISRRDSGDAGIAAVTAAAERTTRDKWCVSVPAAVTVGTGRWKSEQSAARYAHVVPGEDAKMAVMLPVADAKS
jgi:hypothetical protein